jgi:outer membrane autotransporter protein
MAGIGILALASSANGQAVPLGGAASFAIVGASTVTSTGATIITGNIAVSPGSAITGFPPGTVTGTIHANDAMAVQAHADALTAYNTLAAMPFLAANNLTGQDLGGMTLTPGVYRFNTSAQLTGTLNLDTLTDPNAVFVFQIGSTLTTASASHVNVIGAGSLSDPNVFWQVGSSATLGSATAFDGNILALISVTMVNGSNIENGRAIALTGAVTMDTNNIAAPALAPPAAGRYWNGYTSDLWSVSNWSSTVAGSDQLSVGINADVVFSVNPAPLNQNTILDSDTPISSLTVNDTAAVTISGPNTLTIAATGLTTGININIGAGLTTINSKLVLGNLSQIITVNNAAGMRINGVIGGTNGLTKAGTGVLTLTGIETYTGATTVTGGTLQLGNGTTPGTSIATSSSVLVTSGSTFAINLASGETFGNNVTDNGRIEWIQAGTNYQGAASVFSGSGDMLISGAGTSTTVVLGTNNFSGGTTINTPGLVLYGNSTNTSAFGTGVLTINNGYVDTHLSQVVHTNVGGYDQTGGVIGMHLRGTTAGTYTTYDVAGTSNLSGGLVFVYNRNGDYVPSGGDVQNIIHTTAGLSGQFASNAPYAEFYNSAFNQTFYYHQGDTLLYPAATYDSGNAYITWVQDEFDSVPNLTANQNTVGGALDYYQDQNLGLPDGLITYLNGQPIATLPAMYDLIAPDELSAIFQMAFASADLQNTNIERHLELARQTPGSYPATATTSAKDSKGFVVESNSSETITPEYRRWSIFLEGTGGSASVDSSNGISGYDFDTMGVTLGADLRVNDHLVIGILGAYANSEASLMNNGNIDVNSYKGAIYATLFSDGFYLDALLGAGYNEYDTKRSSLLGYATGSPDGWELDTLLNGGYDLHKGNWTFGVMASVAYTKLTLNSFTETGSLSPLRYPEQSQESLRTNLGAKIAYTADVNGIKVTPQVRLSWQHEYLDSTQAMNSQFATGNSRTFTVSGPEIGRDSALISAGVNVQVSPTVNVYAYYDGQLGRNNYSSNSASIGLKVDF